MTVMTLVGVARCLVIALVLRYAWERLRR